MKDNIKIVIVNGRPGSGKTTFEECCKSILGVYCQMRSTVDKIKDIAYRAGWDGKKTPEARKLLSDLKDLFTEFNDLPYRDIVSHIGYYQAELANYGVFDHNALFFVDSREPEEIERFKQTLGAKTLLIKRAAAENGDFSNHADANVNDYEYDFVIDNNGTIADLQEAAKNFIDLIFSEN